MSSALTLRGDALHDGSATADVHRSIVVGSRNVAALLADELGLTPAVGLVAVPALRASLRGVCRINTDERYSGEPSLIGYEGSKLSESPLVVPRTLRLPKPVPALADALEIFETQPSVRIGGLRYKPLRDAMVHITLAATLALGELLEVAFGRLRTRCLQLGADALVALTRLLDAPGGVCLAIRVGSDIDYAQVYPKPVLRRAGRRLFDLDRSEQIPLAAPINEIGFSPAMLQKSTGAFVADERDALAGLVGHGPCWRTSSSPRLPRKRNRRLH